MPEITFNRPQISEQAIERIRQAAAGRHLSGNGPFTQQCQALLERQLGAARVLITHSCTAALEMSAILAGIEPGDEVIMPSYTFVSTANAVVLRGGVPVFVDIREDTLNLDETRIAEAVTSRTKAISAVHYAGVACEMDRISAIAREHGLTLMEDAAQGINATYRGRPLGSIGDLGAISFHETKNIISGEGGALVIRDPEFMERAEIIWEKGTNRMQFARGEISKYTWVDIGSSFLPSDIISAVLLTQLEQSAEITQSRLDAWHRYHAAFESLERDGRLRRPHVPAHVEHNAHLYYLLMPDVGSRDRLLAFLRERGVQAVFHYVPLHSAPAGRRYGRTAGQLPVTDAVSARLVRLPIYAHMAPEDQDTVIGSVQEFLHAAPSAARGK